MPITALINAFIFSQIRSYLADDSLRNFSVPSAAFCLAIGKKTDVPESVSTATILTEPSWALRPSKTVLLPRMKEAARLYEDAAATEPLDAMKRLDVEMAKAELED